MSGPDGSSAPTFSVITPVYNPPLDVLEAMLGSVAGQQSGDWEHCLVDDGSTSPGVRERLEKAAKDDPRVRVLLRPRRGGIVAATNDGIAMARGEFIALLDHDDELEVRALAVMAEQLALHPEVDVAYSDEDKIDRAGRRFDTFVKPGWSPDRLLGQMYTGHLSVLRRSLVEEIGGFRTGFDGAQDWDLVLRATERARRVLHVRDVLYHWRVIAGSSAASSDAKPWAHEASRKVVAEHLRRHDIQAEAEPVPDYPGHYWLRPALRDQPLVSVIIPTAGRSQVIDGDEVPLVVNCVRTLLRRSNYERLELVVVIDDHAPAGVREELLSIGGDVVRLVEFTEPFNFSRKINVGVEASTGEVLLLLNDDIEVVPHGWRPHPAHGAGQPLPTWPTIESGALRTWIECMLVYALQPEVGCVGAKLFFPDGRLQHAGVITRSGSAGHTYYQQDGNACGYWGNLIVPTDHLAVTAACLMVRREVFDQVGGLEVDFPVNYNDVDFCFRVHDAGYRNVLPPHVELLHRESSSRGPAPVKPEEIAMLDERWHHLLHDDPYYDPRFVDSDYHLASPATVAGLARRVRDLYARESFSGLVRAARSRLAADR